MSKKGHYNGGGTLVGRQNMSWFGSSSDKPRKPRVKVPGLLAIEYEEFKKQGLLPSEWAEQQRLVKAAARKGRRKKPK